MKKELLKYNDLVNKRVVLLQSGGLDSLICACLFNHFGFEMHHVFVNYGQNSFKKEYETAKSIIDEYGGELHVVNLSLPWLHDSTVIAGHKVEDWNSDGSLNTIEAGTYVPLRNHFLLSIAGSLAEAKRIPYIASALDGAQDIFRRPTGGTTDKHPYFVKTMVKSLNHGSAMYHVDHKKFTILTPVMDMYKYEIINLGKEINADMSLSWSCYNDEEVPCCECSACRSRALGFYQAGVKDPLLEKFGLEIPLEKLL